MSYKIGLFGGSFDPIHLGHIEIAKIAKSMLELDHVDFIPAKQSPFKQQQTFFDAHQRFELVANSIAAIEHFSASDIEIKRDDQISYSYMTVDSYRQQYPDADLFWIMGEDAWSQIHDWKNIDSMKEKISFVVFSRYQNQSSSLELSQQLQSFKVQFINDVDLPFSSSHIKEQLEQGNLSNLKDLVPKVVFEQMTFWTCTNKNVE